MTNVKQKTTLKSLQTYKSKLEGELPVLKKQMKEASSAFNKAQNTIANLEAEIKAFQEHKELIVSEHALLRYIERVMGIDLESVKQGIVEQATPQYDLFGRVDGKYPIECGRVVVSNNTIVTVEA